MLKKKLTKTNSKKKDTVPFEEFISNPGFKITSDKPKNFLQTLQDLAVPIFEQVYQHPQNNSRQKIKKKHFLGAHPVSLDKVHLNNLIEGFSDFVVCEKTDGVRYLMYITNSGEVILSGRGDDYYMINMPMVPALVNTKPKETEIMYLFDGELVLDTKPDGNKVITYLFFDCILYKGQPIFDKTYLDRLQYCQQFSQVRQSCMEEYARAKKNKVIDIDYTVAFPLIRCFCKDFFALDSSAFIMKYLVPKLPHENDGLIYTRNSVPYPVGATHNIIKWKAPEHNTIDFLAINNMNWENKYGRRMLDLYTIRYNHQSEEHDFIYFDFMIVEENIFDEIGEALDINSVGDDIRYKNDDEREIYVIECNYNHEYKGDIYDQVLNDYLEQGDHFVVDMLEQSALAGDQVEDEYVKNNLHACFEKKIKGMKGNWSIMKVRSDKNLPNAFNTAKNVYNCIFENITLNDVDNAIKTYLENYYKAQQYYQQQQQQQHHHHQQQQQQQPQYPQNNRNQNKNQNYPHEKPEILEENGIIKKVKPDN